MNVIVITKRDNNDDSVSVLGVAANIAAVQRIIQADLNDINGDDEDTDNPTEVITVTNDSGDFYPESDTDVSYEWDTAEVQS